MMYDGTNAIKMPPQLGYSVARVRQKYGDDWVAICDYLSSVRGMRVSLCAGCGKATIWDGEMQRFINYRSHTLKKVKELVEEIKNKALK